LGIYAVLRREMFWGNLDLMVFLVLGGDPRGDTEEGGPCCAFGGILSARWVGFVRLNVYKGLVSL
jgi:hypothetical protein